MFKKKSKPRSLHKFDLLKHSKIAFLLIIEVTQIRQRSVRLIQSRLDARYLPNGIIHTSMITRIAVAMVLQVALDLDKSHINVVHDGGLSALGLIADAQKVSGEILHMTGDIGERVVQVLAPEDDEAKKTGQEEHKKPNEGFELAQAGLLLLLVVLVDFYGGVAAGADQTARVQNEDEQDEDECENGRRGPEQNGLQVVGAVGVEGGVGEDEPHVQVGQGVEGVHDQVHFVSQQLV